MTVLLYATIWAALVCFVAGVTGRRPIVWLTGAVSCWLHIVVAMGVRYGWSHEAALAATARQTAAVYGLDWGGGVYVNYLFAGVWLADALWLVADPRGRASRPRLVTWSLGLFYVVILVNAAIIFASPAGRVAGLLLAAIGASSLFRRKKRSDSIIRAW